VHKYWLWKIWNWYNALSTTIKLFIWGQTAIIGILHLGPPDIRHCLYLPAISLPLLSLFPIAHQVWTSPWTSSLLLVACHWGINYKPKSVFNWHPPLHFWTPANYIFLLSSLVWRMLFSRHCHLSFQTSLEPPTVSALSSTIVSFYIYVSHSCWTGTSCIFYTTCYSSPYLSMRGREETWGWLLWVRLVRVEVEETLYYVYQRQALYIHSRESDGHYYTVWLKPLMVT